MARGPNKKAVEAEKLYRTGMKLVDIADKLEVPAGTVRRWKSTYYWDGEKNEQKKKESERSDKKKTSVRKRTEQKKQAVADEVREVMQNTDLTDKQQLFCVYYIRCFNATKAYQKAYGVDYATAASNSYRMMKNDGVKREIDRLKQYRLNKEMFSEEDVVQMYIDIVHADISDYVDTKHNMIDLTGPLVDGRLIKKVSFGKTDSIELVDKMAALKWLSDHMDMATEKQRAEIALLKSKANAGKDDKEEKLDKFFEKIEGVIKDAE